MSNIFSIRLNNLTFTWYFEFCFFNNLTFQFFKIPTFFDISFTIYIRAQDLYFSLKKFSQEKSPMSCRHNWLHIVRNSFWIKKNRASDNEGKFHKFLKCRIWICNKKFKFYTSIIYEICLHCHLLSFSWFRMNYGQCEIKPLLHCCPGWK